MKIKKPVALAVSSTQTDGIRREKKERKEGGERKVWEKEEGGGGERREKVGAEGEALKG